MSSHSHGSAQHDHAKHPHRHRALSLGAARSRDEARLGITTDYKDLSLHSAAANGNLGLVQYALSHGQPVNSVLNGVLPLHAAASSGNDTIVRMLIEAGADVNSPRLSRRYTREGSKSSGISVGSQGSTPLHFAAANGHVSVLVLLLSFGADPRVPEKHGLTPAQMAATNGHRDAAALLHTRASRMDDADEAGSQASSRSGGGSGRPPSVRSSLSMTRRSSKGGVSAQRSFDALATKLAHASHTTPLHALGLASNSSLHSLASLASSATGHSPHLGTGSPASSSQISLGAVSGAGAAGLAGPVTRQRSRPDGGAGSTTRRPSLPSVWEKAAHPRAALRQAFGRAGDRRPSDASVLSEEDGERSGDEDGGAEYAEHRRSLEVHRPLRRDSYQGTSAGGAERVMDPIEDEGDEDDVPTPVQTRAPQLPLVPPQQPPSPVGTLARAASHQFYRPRQSSQLSRSSFGDGHSSFDADSSVFHDDHESTPPSVPDPPPGAPPNAAAAANPEPTSPTSPRRARATSNPGPQTGARSPLLQQVQLSQQQQQHFHQLQVQLRRSREESGPSGPSGIGGGGGSTASSRPSTSGSGAADGEWSSSAENEDGAVPYSGAGAPRARGPPSFDARRTFLDLGAAGAPPSSSPALSLQVAAAQNRARSNSASTDGSLAARSSYSFAPSTSTAPTSVGTPSSPGGANAAGRHGHGHHGKEAAMTSMPMGPPQGRYLAPVYELRPPPPASRSAVAPTSEDDEPKTKAQARSRVQRAERELLALAHEAGASSSRAGSNGSSGSRATSQRSLKDQLAAYGKSLKAEKELVEREEREQRVGGGARKDVPVAPGFTFETISKSATASTSPSSSAPPTPTPTSVPSWRAIPPVDRLGPPSTAAHGRRSVSPSATSSSAAATHRRRPSQELDTVMVPAKASSPRSAHHHHHHHHQAADGGASVPAPARAASPTSTRSGSAKSSSTTTAAAGAAGASVPAVAPVLGQGHGGVQFVGVAPKPAAPTASSPLAGPPHSHAHTHAHPHHQHHHHGSQPRTSRSDKSHSERGGAAAAAGAKKTRDQVEEDRREKARLEERVPKAVRTVPSERKGFKRWFGNSSAAAGGGAGAGPSASKGGESAGERRP
ncbi:hypothetical protein JCM9279_002827 [Rhodotorula babjevae]